MLIRVRLCEFTLVNKRQSLLLILLVYTVLHRLIVPFANFMYLYNYSLELSLMICLQSSKIKSCREILNPTDRNH